MEDVALGHENRHRWNDPSQWAWSRAEAHEPLISTDLYESAQQTIKKRGTNSDTGLCCIKPPSRSSTVKPPARPLMLRRPIGIDQAKRATLVV